MTSALIFARAAALLVILAAPACKSVAGDAGARPEKEPLMTHDDTTDSKKPAQTIPPKRAPDPVEPTHYLFIGKPVDYKPLDCAIFESIEAPHRRPPEPLNDATDHPERLQVDIEFVEALQDPAQRSASEGPIMGRLQERPARTLVAFALGDDAFRAPDARVDYDAYDRAYCERLNRLLGSNFVVLHAYPVYVDRGNSLPDFWRDTWGSLGTDPGKANAGFATLEEAKRYASTLLPKTP